MIRVRADRDQNKVDTALSKLAQEAADDAVNLMPTLIECVSTYATLGEIMSTLLAVFGRHTEVPTI